jgi:hypothetical protein
LLARHVLAVVGFLAEGLRDLRHGVVVVGVLHGARGLRRPTGRRGELPGDVAVLLVLVQTLAAVEVGVGCGGLDLGVLFEGFVGRLVVHASEPFGEGVGDQHVAVGAAAGVAVVAGDAAVGHPAGVAVDVHQRLHHVALPLGLDEREQRVDGAEGVPEDVVVLIVGLGPEPGELAGHVVRHDHRVVQGGAKDPALLLRAALDLDFVERFLPGGLGPRLCRLEVPVRQARLRVGARLLHALEGDPHPGVDGLVLRRIEGSDGAETLVGAADEGLRSGEGPIELEREVQGVGAGVRAEAPSPPGREAERGVYP